MLLSDCTIQSIHINSNTQITDGIRGKQITWRRTLLWRTLVLSACKTSSYTHAVRTNHMATNKTKRGLWSALRSISIFPFSKHFQFLLKTNNARLNARISGQYRVHSVSFTCGCFSGVPDNQAPSTNKRMRRRCSLARSTGDSLIKHVCLL